MQKFLNQKWDIVIWSVRVDYPASIDMVEIIFRYKYTCRRYESKKAEAVLTETSVKHIWRQYFENFPQPPMSVAIEEFSFNFTSPSCT